MNTREMTWTRNVEWVGLLKLVALMGAALLISNLGMPQWITGPLVNALLILTVLWLGVSQAIFVGMVTPLGAVLSGILPLPLLVMIPFIAIGNAILVSVFGSVRRVNQWVALVIAAVAKAAFLFLAVTLLVAHPAQPGDRGAGPGIGRSCVDREHDELASGSDGIGWWRARSWVRLDREEAEQVVPASGNPLEEPLHTPSIVRVNRSGPRSFDRGLFSYYWRFFRDVVTGMFIVVIMVGFVVGYVWQYNPDWLWAIRPSHYRGP